MAISIQCAKRVLEENDMTHVVIFAMSQDGAQHIATFGKTKQNAREAAKAGNSLKAHLGWEQRPAIPLQRICKNCDYYTGDYGIHCFNGWTGDGSQGWCMAAPKRVGRLAEDRACTTWEPKG